MKLTCSSLKILMSGQRQGHTSVIHCLFRKLLDCLVSEAGKFPDADLKGGNHNFWWFYPLISLVRPLMIFLSLDAFCVLPDTFFFRMELCWNKDFGLNLLILMFILCKLLFPFTSQCSTFPWDTWVDAQKMNCVRTPVAKFTETIFLYFLFLP